MNAYDIKDLLPSKPINPWEGTPLENYYTLTPSSKGHKMETIVCTVLTSLGYNVSGRTNPGHDRIINGIKTEIKCATAVDRNTDWGCIYNHISFEKDWDQILLVCINGNCEIRGVMYKKNDFLTTLLNRQQGGGKSSNDDYMVEPSNSKEILFNKQATVII